MQKADIGGKEKAGKRVRKKLLSNLGLKLVSVVIAIVVWFAIVIMNNPKASRVYANIPVKLINTELLENENKVYEVLENTDVVRVTVEVARNDLNLLRSTDIVAEADMADLTAINTIAIKLSVTNDDINVVSISGNHDTVKLNVEDKASRWYSIVYKTTGDVAEGHMVSNVIRDPTRIQITGPKSVIEQVSSVEIEIDVTGATSDQTANVRPQLYDAKGNLLDASRVTMDSDSVHVEARILATKEVPIELNPAGTPAEGYLATGVARCEPSKVLLAGTPAALAGINKISIPGEDLDVSGSTGNLVNTMNIKKYLPENVSLADKGFDGRVKVTVYVEPIVERTLNITQSNIDILNMPDGTPWEFAPDSGPYELKIFGLEAEVSAVEEETLRGTADIDQWMKDSRLDQLAPGTYRIPVSVELDEEIEVEGQIYVQLTILDLEEEEQDG